MKYQFLLTFIVSILLFNTTQASNLKKDVDCTQTGSYTVDLVEDCGNGLTVTTSFTSTQTAYCFYLCSGARCSLQFCSNRCQECCC